MEVLILHVGGTLHSFAPSLTSIGIATSDEFAIGAIFDGLVTWGWRESRSAIRTPDQLDVWSTKYRSTNSFDRLAREFSYE